MRSFMFPLGLVACIALSTELRSARAGPGDAAVVITMSVPADAEVWFNGTKTKQNGANRQFVSPPIAAGRNYSYEVRVVSAGDRKKDVTRSLAVRAGDRIRLDFTGGQGTSAGYYDPEAAPSSGATAAPVSVSAGPTIEPFDSQTNPNFASGPQG